MSPVTSRSNAHSIFFTGQAQLPHVGDIKQTGGAAGMEMFRPDPLVILYRHFITGKVNKPGAMYYVQVM